MKALKKILVTLKAIDKVQYAKGYAKGYIKGKESMEPKEQWMKKAESNSDMILFHGSCHGCTAQFERDNWYKSCKKCCNLDGDWSKPDLSDEGMAKENMVSGDKIRALSTKEIIRQKIRRM